jgi:hypothetical protein
MLRYTASIFFILMLILTSYAQAKEVNLIFKHTVNGEKLKLNETLFPIWNGKKIILTRAEFYLSKFNLLGKDGKEVSFPDNYMLINTDDNQSKHLVGSIDNGMDLNSLSFYIGVNKEKNHLDPTTYPEEHPLALKEPSMHWGWAGGYRFMAIEGQVDLDNDSKPETDLQYHNLGDDLYKQAVVSIETDETASSIDITLVLDYTKLFEKLTMIGNNIVHGSSTKNATMIANATTGGFFKQEIESATADQETTPTFTMASSSQSIYFNFENEMNNAFVKAFDSGGKLLASRQISGKEVQIEKATLPPSIIYFTLFRDNKAVSTKKYVNY